MPSREVAVALGVLTLLSWSLSDWFSSLSDWFSSLSLRSSVSLFLEAAQPT